MPWSFSRIIRILMNFNFALSYNINFFANKYADSIDIIHHWSKKSLMIGKQFLNFRENIQANFSVFIRYFSRRIMIDLLKTENINVLLQFYELEKWSLD